MARKPLPNQPEELQRFAYQCGETLLYVTELLDLLRSFEDEPCTFLRVSIRPAVRTRFTSRISCASVLDLPSCINKGVPEATTEVAELIDYFDLSESERRRLRTRAFQLTSSRSDWALEGFAVVENEEGGPGSMAGPNAVRVAGLTGFFEPAASALADLYQRVERKLNPPPVRDRVKVDRMKFTVTIDGREPIQVTENQALLFHYLAEANGEGLSGPEIRDRAGWGKVEFKASLYHRQIKDPWLKSLIPPRDEKQRKFRLVLPPLA